jgi:uncharacterized surface protein with fasciclin (FAS1) repeats
MSYQDQDQRGLGEGPRDRRLHTITIWETLEEDGRFRRFLAAARTAELENNLRGPGFMTVFAVPDEVLADADSQVLREVVGHHVVRGMQKAVDLRTTPSVKSMAGVAMPVARDGVDIRFGDAKLVRTDIACTNGMIHILDKLVREPAHAG